MKNFNKTITEFLFQSQGFDISKYDEKFLAKSVSKRMKDTFCTTEEAYLSYLEESFIESEQFIHSLQISYSEFFRNSLTFSVLEKIVFPTILMRKTTSKNKEIRIWSTACASGQETYSLAMLMKELLKGHDEKINFRIFATDQSDSQITEAKKGIYHESSLGYLSLRRLKEWFTKEGEYYAIKPELKDNIDFSTFDLLSKEHSSPPNSIFGDFDIVFCANLLFYYKPKFRKLIIEKTGGSLSKEGFLVTGETEREILMNSDFSEIFSQSSIFIPTSNALKFK
jgi:chemotaxis methyl-accepting protein methylase